MLQATGSRAVNYDDAPGAIDLSMVPKSGNPVYYVRTDGTAGSLAAATGPETNAAACMDLSDFNGSYGAALVPGDVVIFSGASGAAYSSQITIPASGSPGLPIIVRGSLVSPPTVTVTSTSKAIFANDRTDVHIGFFPDVSNTDGGEACVQFDGDCARIKVEGVHVTRNRNAAADAGDDAFSLNQTSQVDFRNISAADYKDGATGGSDQAITTHQTAVARVFGYTFTNGNQGAVAVDQSRIELHDGRMSDLAVRYIDAGDTAEVQVYRSDILVDGAGGLFDCSDSAFAGYKDCDIRVTAGQQVVISGGTCAIEGGSLRMDTTAERYLLDAASAVFRMTDVNCTVLRLNTGLARQNSAGALQIEGCLFDCSSATAGTQVFRHDGGSATGEQYIRGNVFKGANQLSNGGIWCRAADSPFTTLLIEGNTFWNASDSGRAITREAVQSGQGPIIRNNGFVNFVSALNNDSFAELIEFNGFRNTTSVGTDEVVGDPLLLDPANNDFRLQSGEPGSAWRGAGKGGVDIGAGLVFA